MSTTSPLLRETNCAQGRCACNTTGCPIGQCAVRISQQSQLHGHHVVVAWQPRKSAQDMLAVLLGVMKDCGYSAEEVKAALRFFAEPKP